MMLAFSRVYYFISFNYFLMIGYLVYDIAKKVIRLICAISINISLLISINASKKYYHAKDLKYDNNTFYKIYID
jgi:hypothetical protein